VYSFTTISVSKQKYYKLKLTMNSEYLKTKKRLRPPGLKNPSARFAGMKSFGSNRDL
jgi:hypothetical protein